MARPRKKPAPPDPALEAMVDTLADDTNPEEQPAKPSRPRQQKPGPKKVLGETTRIVGDGLAVGIMLATSQPDQRKNLTMEEAQSIGHPVTRMLGRRVPGWLKPLFPKTKLNPDDAADIEEILATIGRWGMRLVTILVQDFVESREREKQSRQAKQAMENSKQAQHVANSLSQSSNGNWERLEASVREQLAQQKPPAPPAAAAVPQQNGHNPAFDILPNIDLGIEV